VAVTFAVLSCPTSVCLETRSLNQRGGMKLPCVYYGCNLQSLFAIQGLFQV